MLFWVDRLRMDLRLALRALIRHPGMSAAVIGILAISIGLNTAVFSVIRAVLLRPLSFAQPERMIWLATLEERGHDEYVGSHDVLAWREARSLERLVAYDVFDGRLVVDGESGPGRIATVSDDFWLAAGVPAVVGRLPIADQSHAMLSWAMFERRFGANPSILGKPVVVNGRPAEIVGVLPPSFHADLVQPQLWPGAPASQIDVYHSITVRPLPSGAIQLYSVIGQLRDGVSLQTARAELETIRARVAQSNRGASFRPTLRIAPLEDRLLGSARADLTILFAGVALVLLIGCANIAGLLVTRAVTLQKEMAIRTALGAGRAGLLTPVFLEGLLLTAAGAAVGVLFARESLQLIRELVPAALPRLPQARLDTPVLVFTVTVSGLTALLFSVAPIAALRRGDVSAVLKGAGQSSATARHGVRLRTWLVAGEIVITVVLLCGAGLLVRSLVRVRSQPVGFDPGQIVTVSVPYSTAGLPRTDGRPREYIAEVLRRVERMPGVNAVGMTTNSSGRLLIVVEGAPPPATPNRNTALLSLVSEGFARAIGMRVVRGRWISDAESQPACVINELVAARDFPGEDPIGRRIQIGGPPGASEPAARFATIVGVVADLRYAKLETPPEPEVFADYRHTAPFAITIAARVSANSRAVGQRLRDVIADVDGFQSVSEPKTVAATLNDSIAPRRFTAALLGTFAASALALALVGIYGVMAYSVALQTREIGIRMALGAARADVLRMVIRRGAAIASIGLGVGIAIALAVTRVMAGLLYEIAPTDPLTFVVVCLVMAVTAMAACAGPALKASRLNPADALRFD